MKLYGYTRGEKNPRKERTHQVLVREVQRAGQVLAHAPMQRLDTRVAGSRAVGVVLEDEAGAAEAELRLEDGAVVEGDLERLVLGRVIEAGQASLHALPGAARGGVAGELDDLGPGVVALDGARVEEAGGRGVKVLGLGVDGNLTGEDDWAGNLGHESAGVTWPRHSAGKRCHGKERCGDERLERHCACMVGDL